MKDLQMILDAQRFMMMMLRVLQRVRALLPVPLARVQAI